VTERSGLILLGGGGHAAVVGEAARAAGWNIAGFLDDRDGVSLPGGVARLGAIDDLPEVLSEMRSIAAIHAAVGDATLRRAWLDDTDGVELATIIHPSAVISPSAEIDDGVFIGPRAVVNARTRIERGAIVNSGAIIEHDCRLGAFCHVAPGAVLAGSVRVGADALVGATAVVCPGLRIGDRATIGAGAAVSAEIADDARVAGVPARPLPAPAAQVAP
jgi:sugar O-acyltransferase (sialic acid O-acetyltransferase NeuD family)